MLLCTCKRDRGQRIRPLDIEIQGNCLRRGQIRSAGGHTRQDRGHTKGDRCEHQGTAGDAEEKVKKYYIIKNINYRTTRVRHFHHLNLIHYQSLFLIS